MSSHLKILEKDSDFFSMNIGKIETNSLNENSKEVFEHMCEFEIDLAYYSSSSPIPSNLRSSGYKILLVERKITLIKRLDKESRIHPKISLYKKNKANKALQELALISGLKTRFFTDPHFSESVYRKLFLQWIDKSVKGEMATHVLVYKENNKIVGFITIRADKKIPHIVLMAVEPAFEGKGISFALLRAAERVLIEEGFKQFSGATTINNKKALAVYNRHGPDDIYEEFIYHLWRNEIKNE